MKLRRVFALAVSSLTLAAAGVFATAAPASAYTNSCATGRVASLANNLRIYAYPDVTSQVWTVAQMGYQYNCSTGYVHLGGRYTACGASNANGWIVILFNSGDYGYAYMTCLKDV
ncbi:hypothetical protein AB0I37_22860 [Micromonospora purpureochromogenes]|uniref:hypothetical protein n=1 Tax=Micromonospora purpureochromogenes TaxID=47872 RepID=UPI0033C9E78A